jgi:hypothetical protein
MSIKNAGCIICYPPLYQMIQRVEDIKPEAESSQPSTAILLGQRGVYNLHIRVPAEMLLVSTNRLKPLLYGVTARTYHLNDTLI